MFAAFIPALLMLGTFGLERVESALGNRDDTDAIDELVAQIPPKVERPTQHAGRAAPPWSSRLTPDGSFPGLATLDSEPRLPTRLCRHETANPQFQATRHANSV